MPEQAQPATPKICIRCGQDCAGRPRSRDSKGRYTCQPCIDAAMAKQRDAEFRKEAAAIAPLPAHLLDPDPDAGKPLPLAPEPVHAAGPCPKCKAPMVEGAVLCTSCGYNREAGGRVKTITGDTAGPRDKRQIEREMAAKAYRWEFIKPALMFCISFFIIAGILAANNEARLIPFALIVSLINVVIGLGVFWVCSLVYIDFEGPLALTALRLAGIFGVAEVAAIAAGALIPVPFVGWLIPTVIYLALLSQMLELEVGDAIIVAVVNSILRTAIYLFIIMRL